jgi:hypothetical protein
MKKNRRGQCQVCLYRFRLRADGTVQAHYLWSGTERQPACEGSGKAPRPFDPNECGDCMMHVFRTPGLTEACASVGIEYGKSTGQMMHDYLAGYHDRGHREQP